MRAIWILLYKLFGWKIDGALPPTKKYICAVGPHTSNWDVVWAMGARSILEIKHAKFLGKSQLFKAPYGWFFRMVGGIPVYRDTNNDMVDQVSAIIKNSDAFVLAIAPEGTRKKVTKLKTGFWYISKASNIPIVPVGLDYSKKTVVVGAPIYPTDVDRDMGTLIEFYKNITGKNPELGIS